MRKEDELYRCDPGVLPRKGRDSGERDFCRRPHRVIVDARTDGGKGDAVDGMLQRHIETAPIGTRQQRRVIV